MKNPALLIASLGAAAVLYLMTSGKASGSGSGSNGATWGFDTGGSKKLPQLTIAASDVTKATKLPGKVVSFRIRVDAYPEGQEEYAQPPELNVQVLAPKDAFANIGSEGGVEALIITRDPETLVMRNAYPSTVTAAEFASSLASMMKPYVSRVNII